MRARRLIDEPEEGIERGASRPPAHAWGVQCGGAGALANGADGWITETPPYAENSRFWHHTAYCVNSWLITSLHLTTRLSAQRRDASANEVPPNFFAVRTLEESVPGHAWVVAVTVTA